MEVRSQGSGRRRAFQLETLEGRALLSAVHFAHRVPAVIEVGAHSERVREGGGTRGTLSTRPEPTGTLERCPTGPL
jgi:hypothetical protein